MEIGVVARGYSDRLKSRVSVLDFHQRFGMVVREGPQQHVFDDAEDGGVRADAQSERQDRDGRESGALAQGAQTKLQVVGKIAEPAGFRHRSNSLTLTTKWRHSIFGAPQTALYPRRATQGQVITGGAGRKRATYGMMAPWA